MRTKSILVNTALLLSAAVVLGAGLVTFAQDRLGDRFKELDTSPVRQGPKLLIPGEHGIGGLVADAEFQDLNGKKHHFSDFSDRKAVVIAMTSTSCPLSRKYLPTLVELAKTYSARGVALILVNPVATDEDSDIKTARQSFSDTAIYVADREENLARTVGAKSTTDIIVLDGQIEITIFLN